MRIIRVVAVPAKEHKNEQNFKEQCAGCANFKARPVEEPLRIVSHAVKQYSWAELKMAAAIGILPQVIQSGDEVTVTLKNGKTVTFVATYDEKGHNFFVLKDCLDEERKMNSECTNEGGWAESDMRKYINEKVFALLPDDLQAVISPTKIVQIIDGERVETKDKLFLLSKTQVFGKGDWTKYEPEDTQLDIFTRERDRVKECGAHGTWWWWLRSPVASSSSLFYYVPNNGISNYNYANSSTGVAFGFSL